MAYRKLIESLFIITGVVGMLTIMLGTEFLYIVAPLSVPVIAGTLVWIIDGDS